MKTVNLLVALFTFAHFAPAFAQGGADRVGGGQTFPILLSVKQGSNPMMLNPVLRETQINGNGRVVQTVTNFRNGTGAQPEITFKLVTIIRDLTQIQQCVAQLDQAVFKPVPFACEDAPVTTYSGMYGQKAFAEAACGQVQQVPIACAADMIALLNRYNQ